MLLRVPAMVIVLIFRLDQPFRAKELSTLLGTDYQTTRGYLRDLAHPEVGFLTHNRQGWVLAVGGRQLILPGAAAAGEPAPGAPALELESAEEAEPQSTRRTQRRFNRSAQAAGKAEKAHFLGERAAPQSTRRTQREKSAEKPRFRENLQVMDEQGIKANATTRLIAAMDHVTPDYIRVHTRYAARTMKN